MSVAADATARLLSLGDPGRGPAGAVVGVRTTAGTEVHPTGWATLPREGAPGEPMTAGTWLDLASVTKVAATTVLLLRLSSDGALSVDDPVRRFVPAFDGGGREDVTVHHLLTHTSGLRPWWPLYAGTRAGHDVAERIAALDLAGPPGREVRYSDLGMVLAGRVVERVLGTDLATAVREHVSQPLGLDLRYGPVDPAGCATSADSDAVEHAMLATGRPYPVPVGPDDVAVWRKGPLRGEVADGNAAHALGGVAGHAGLFGTADALLDLGTALLDGTVAGPDAAGRAATAGEAHPDRGLGFRLHHAPGPDGPVTWLWHGGFTGTFWGVEPGSRTVVAGAATRLHGTVGPLPGPRTVGLADPLAGVATGDEIAGVLLDAGTTALTTAAGATR
ncbi:beta-lactamase family protein [Phycicoccus sp. BSK3Z-2]|uniref:Beta-lactamase family protein n=1 Tax=Phycicoccus avicenniae TaxID=2828860 RepID=A0A941D8W0_9MICO|nr:serine hydrolase domain-containing protein [Phycicoccus avicenniae]MBR7744254.1 beta-lactamase family protein [Phycicoccus avicenniae]